MRALVPPVLLDLPRYQAGRSIEAVMRQFGLDEVIKLASNENPFGPSPLAVEAMRAALGQVYRYPDDGQALRETLGDALKVSSEHIVLGAGATDLIELCVRTFASSDGHAVISQGSFVGYWLFLRAAGVPTTATALRDHSIDLEAILAAVGPQTQLIFLPNPNNPTGSSIGSAEMEQFVSRLPEDVVLVLDDAYKDYHDRPDAPDSLALLRSRPRTLVLQSFSKAHGLAGMRVGYAIASEELVACLQRVHRPFAVSRLALEGALAALHDHEHLQRTVEGTALGRRLLTEGLQELGFSPLPSQANFVTFRLAGEQAVTTLTERLLSRGFIVRPLGPFGLSDHIRVSVAREGDLKRFLANLGGLLREEPELRA